MTRETLACLGQMVCSTNLALKAYGAAPAKRLGSPRGVAEVMCAIGPWCLGPEILSLIKLSSQQK
jgi:hypothetical protein